MTPVYVPRIVNFEYSDYQAVKRCAQEKGLGGKGFSAAMRLIIREWQAYQQCLAYPTHPQIPDPQTQIHNPQPQIPNP
jgi:hypothetical protein